MKFGVAGYPPAFFESKWGKDRLKIFDWLSTLGLDALELQMTYGPRTTAENCRALRKAAEDRSITLSIHASYFVVLTSDDPAKIGRSIDTLMRTYELAELLGASNIVLHPGPLYGLSADKILPRFRENLHAFLQKAKGSSQRLCLETAGKQGQLGSIEEIIKLCRDIPEVFPCVDFGHIHAYTVGGYRTTKEIEKVFEQLAGIGAFPSRAHFHYTPIDYGPRGEKVHKKLGDIREISLQKEFFQASVDLQYHPRPEPIAGLLRRYAADCTLISECHNSQQEGAGVLKELYFQEQVHA